MKKWIALGLVLGLLGTGIVYSAKVNPVTSGTQMGSDVSSRVIDSASVDSAVSNIPTSFDLTAGSRILDSTKGAHGFCILNYTESDLAGNYTSPVITPAPTAVEFYVPAAATGSFTAYCGDFHYPGIALFLKSDTGSPVSAGRIRAWTY